MPELVRCPFCGVGVRISDAYLGNSLVCSACGHSFVASNDPPPPRPLRTALSPLPAPTGAPALLCCPQCHRCVAWDVPRCPYCGEEFEPESGPPPGPDPAQRRDWVPHRGRLLCTLGIISLALNIFSLCTNGIAGLLSVVAALTTWFLAQQDLKQMRAGTMDPSGTSPTEIGRNLAVFGGFLGLMQSLAFGAYLMKIWF